MRSISETSSVSPPGYDITPQQVEHEPHCEEDELRPHQSGSSLTISPKLKEQSKSVGKMVVGTIIPIGRVFVKDALRGVLNAAT